MTVCLCSSPPSSRLAVTLCWSVVGGQKMVWYFAYYCGSCEQHPKLPLACTRPSLSPTISISQSAICKKVEDPKIDNKTKDMQTLHLTHTHSLPNVKLDVNKHVRTRVCHEYHQSITSHQSNSCTASLPSIESWMILRANKQYKINPNPERHKIWGLLGIQRGLWMKLYAGTGGFFLNSGGA